MAHISVVAALLIGVSYVVFRLISKVVETRRRAEKARELGCKEPPHEPSRLPFGIDKVRAAIKADKAKLFLEWIADRHAAMGVSTCKSGDGRLSFISVCVANDEPFILDHDPKMYVSMLIPAAS